MRSSSLRKAALRVCTHMFITGRDFFSLFSFLFIFLSLTNRVLTKLQKFYLISYISFMFTILSHLGNELVIVVATNLKLIPIPT